MVALLKLYLHCPFDAGQPRRGRLDSRSCCVCRSLLHMQASWISCERLYVMYTFSSIAYAHHRAPMRPACRSPALLWLTLWAKSCLFPPLAGWAAAQPDAWIHGKLRRAVAARDTFACPIPSGLWVLPFLSKFCSFCRDGLSEHRDVRPHLLQSLVQILPEHIGVPERGLSHLPSPHARAEGFSYLAPMPAATKGLIHCV